MLGKAVDASRTARQLEVIHVHLSALNRALDENVHFELLSGRNVIRAIVLPGSKAVHVTAKTGEWVGINATSGAKAVLAFMAPDQLEAMVKAHPVLRAFTGSTIKDWNTLKRQLAQIRQSGIASDQEEYMEGINGVGVPAFDSSGTVLGAVVVVVPVDRTAIISAKKTKDLLKVTASRISEDLKKLP
jgi:DNA-binding IclR family transcriptional regulator